MLHTMNIFTTSQKLTNDNKSNITVLYDSSNNNLTYSTNTKQPGMLMTIVSLLRQWFCISHRKYEK